MGDQRTLADPLMRPSQIEASFPGQLCQPLARPMHELGVGRKGHRLGLHGGVDDHLGKIGRLRRAGAGGDREALLDQRDEPLLPPRAPRQ